ncbi:MAG TPA: hypothetical protein VK416_08300 [Thermoanaerobaculia bacterium]|jgi:hypothetical protein|nr:hypothetical protein [Thermoanaerobaculia bacterium]
MLKISRPEPESQSASWKLEGRLVGPWVAELRQVADAALSESDGLTLDVSEVSFVDREGKDLLHELIARRVRLVHPSAFLRELLNGGQR